MKQKKLSPDFRKLFSDKLMDLGNLAVVALVFGQFITGKPISIPPLVFGLLFVVACYIVSYIINR